MIRTFTRYTHSFSETISKITTRLKKERTRLKLRRRGSFADSSWISLALRPLLESDQVKALLGAPIALALVVGTAQIPSYEDPEAVVAESVSQDVLVMNEADGLETIKSEKFFFLPTSSLTGVSQYFHSGHPGIDLRSPLGSEVVAMDEGVVKQIANSKFGYGRHVIIEHEQGLTTLYAHLGLIHVEEGEEVTAGEKIGEIGMTAWTTGPHLHFEIRSRESLALNPVSYLKPALRDWYESQGLAAK